MMGTILEDLTLCWKELTSYIPEGRLLCLYRYGESGSEIGYEALYLPSFEELCFDKPRNDKIVCNETTEIHIRGIQSIFLEGFLVKNDKVKDMFSTKYVYVNPKYKEIFYSCFRGKAIDFFLTESYFARMYYKAVDAFPTAPTGKTKDILANIIQSYEQYSLVNKPISEYNFYSNFKSSICALIKISQTETAKQAAAAAFEKDKQIALERLTEFTYNEVKVIQSVIKEIQTEGNISVVKLIQSTGISRPVFTRAFEKLKTFNLAEVTNCGVKGTNIKFCHPEFFNEVQKIKVD